MNIYYSVVLPADGDGLTSKWSWRMLWDWCTQNPIHSRYWGANQGGASIIKKKSPDCETWPVAPRPLRSQMSAALVGDRFLPILPWKVNHQSDWVDAQVHWILLSFLRHSCELTFSTKFETVRRKLKNWNKKRSLQRVMMVIMTGAGGSVLLLSSKLTETNKWFFFLFFFRISFVIIGKPAKLTSGHNGMRF
jgi:hypothetical protein